MKIKSIYKSKYLAICVLVTIIFMSGCVTNAPNIKSVNDLKGSKMLVGRFVFYVNDELVEPYEIPKHEYSDDSEESKRESKTDTEEKKVKTGFTILMENGKTMKLMVDKQGYIYIPVEVGRYFITRITRHNILYGTYKFQTLNSGINVQNLDAVVNFGTIKVEFRQNAASQATGVLERAVYLTGIPTTSNLFAQAHLRVTQPLDFDVPRNYISSKFSILPELIRDETIKFSAKLEEPFK